MDNTIEKQDEAAAAGAEISIDEALRSMLTPEQVAERFGKTIYSVNWAISHGSLPCRCILNRRQIRIVDAEKWASEVRQGRPRGPIREVRPVQKRGMKLGGTRRTKRQIAEEAARAAE